MNSIKKRFLVFFMGLFFAVIFIEIGLRVAGSINSKRENSGNFISNYDRSDKYKILCIGDSFTYGMGAKQDEGYPSQLERLLNSKAKAEIFTVINDGMLSRNSSDVLRQLQKNIDEIKPHLIILLIGCANRWSSDGYYEYRLRKEKSGGISRLTAGLIVFQRSLYNLRIYNLLRLLYFDVKDKGENGSLEGKPAGLPPKEEGTQWQYLRQKKYKQAIECFLKEIEMFPDQITNYIGIGKAYYKIGEYEDAVEWLKKAAVINPYECSKHYVVGKDVDCNGRYNEMIEYFKQKEDSDYGKNSNYYFGIGWAYLRLGKFEEGISWFKRIVKINPQDIDTYKYIAFIYLAEGRYKEGFNFLCEELKNNSALEEIIAMYKARQFHYEESNSWIISDVEEIIDICRKNKVKIILQNYPPVVRPVVSILLREAAKRYQVPFVDNYQIFYNLLLDKELIEDVFSGDKKHCSERGYGIMAENIYDKMAKEGIVNF